MHVCAQLALAHMRNTGGFHQAKLAPQTAVMPLQHVEKQATQSVVPA